MKGASWRVVARAIAGLVLATAGVAFAQAPPAPASKLATPKMEIYGRLHMSMDGVSLDNDYTYLQFPSNTSIFGFRGTQDLGPVKALWQIESNVNVANGVTNAIGVGSRDTFVGLWSNYGTVKAGFFYSPYYYAVSNLDPLTQTIADFRSVIHNTGWGNRVEFSTRLTNTVQYVSPKFSGFEFQAQYANPEQAAGVAGGKRVSAFAPNPGDGDVLGGVYALSLTYKQGPLYAAAAWERHNSVDRTGDDLGIEAEDAVEVGLGYTFPTKTTVTAVYEYIKRGGVNDGDVRTRPVGLFASVKQDFGNESLVGTFGYAGSSKALGGNDDGGFFGLGYFHHFGRSTDVYAVFAKSFNGDASRWGLGTQGHGTTINPNADGKGPLAASIGLIHRFSFGL